MRHAFSIRARLLTNIMSMVVVMGGLIIASTFWFSRRQVERLSASIIDHTLAQAEQELDGFFEPVYANLRLAKRWGEEGLLDPTKPEEIKRLFGPIMSNFRHISGIMIADTLGRECMLMRQGDDWKIRLTRRDEWGSNTRWMQWHEDTPAAVEHSEKELDYDPRKRPWFENAVAHTHEHSDTDVFWTAPYIFYTSQDPGITASARHHYTEGDTAVTQVIGFDVLLNDISEFTMNLRVSRGGSVIVITHDMEVIGLPSDPRFDDPAVRREYLLKHPDQLGTRFAHDASKAFANLKAGERKPVRFASEGESWWGKGRLVHLSPVRHLWVGVLVPEEDVLGDIVYIRVIIVTILLCTLLGAVLRAIVLSRRFSMPVEMLVADSDRMSRGDLEPGERIESDITEYSHLAAAHDRMRQGLKVLLKLEGDLKLARDIQQQTFPKKLPNVKGFDIVAWNCPADETGGDTYDVIGYRTDNEGRIVNVCDEDVDGVILLLADATGHGIGPALSVTQVRAMLRMAIRNGTPLPQVVEHLNEQLYADLPTGRFVTTWLGDVSVREGSLLRFSAGQGPILHYDAATDSVAASDADAMPLGITPTLSDPVPPPLMMQVGDIHAVISDGIFEASAPSGEDFGKQRAIDVIQSHHNESAADILKALRAAVDDFCDGTSQEDDQTVILIKRV